MSREDVLLESGYLRLTAQRVVFDRSERGRSRYQCMPLDAVTDVGLITDSKPVALVGGLVFLAIGAVQFFNAQAVNGAETALAVAIVLLAFYVGSRRSILKISAGSGEAITLDARGVARGQIIKIADAIHVARHELMAAQRR